MTVIALRNDPVRQIAGAVAALGEPDQENTGRLRHVADLILKSVRNGYIDLNSLPLLTMAHCDGSDLADAMEHCFRRWDVSGYPSAAVLAGDVIRQLGIQESDPMAAAVIEMAGAIQNPARAARIICFTAAMPGLLPRHGSVFIEAETKLMMLAAALVLETSENAADAAESIRLAFTRSGIELEEVEATAAMVHAQAASDILLPICRSAEDDIFLPSEKNWPDWAATLCSDPMAAVGAGIIADMRLIISNANRSIGVPAFCSLSGALFGRLFANEDEITASASM